jgi:predicted transcriptional regulator
MVHVAPHVSDYMDKSFITLQPDMDVYKAIQILLDGKITGAAVVDDKENLVGILSEKDCLRTLIHDAYSNLPSAKVSDYMTKNPVTIHPDLDVFTVADIFLNRTFRRLLVVKEGKLVGQITRRDLLRAIQKIKLTE